jgi:hypothetical protein
MSTEGMEVLGLSTREPAMRVSGCDAQGQETCMSVMAQRRPVFNALFIWQQNSPGVYHPSVHTEVLLPLGHLP